MHKQDTKTVHRSVLLNDYKFILTTDNKEKLYNLKIDPAETDNLSCQPAYHLLLSVMRNKFFHSLPCTEYGEFYRQRN